MSDYMKKKILFLILIIFILDIFIFYLDEDSGIKDNYYLFINKDIIADNTLADGEYSWSNFLDSQEVVDDEVSLIVDDILSGNVSGLSIGEINTIKSIYDKVLDMNKRDIDDINALEPYLNKVWNVSNIDELIEVVIFVEQELGVDLFSKIEVVSDYYDNSKNIIYFYPVTYAFGASSDYMVDEDYMTYKAYIRRACVQLWKAYGYNSRDAREVVERVFNFYENIAYSSKLSFELDEIVDYYHIVSSSDVNNLFSNIESNYLTRRGIDGYDSYSLVDNGQYKAINDSLTYSNLEVWKEVIVTKILSSYAGYCSTKYVDVVDNLNESLMGEDSNKTNEDKAKIVIKNLFSSEIDKIYVKYNLTEEQVNEVLEMFLEIKEIFKVRIKNNSWLSEEAKEKALVKLDKMDIIIGLDNQVLAYNMAEYLVVSNNSLISDVIMMQQLAMKSDLERLDSGDKINLIKQTQVNAYYQPLDNSIVIPVAFFELVDEKDSYYEKLGTLGMIIAHEVTHAFDGNGSMFDENGNLNNWWTNDDKEYFNSLKEKVSNYYSKYEVLDGKYINGDKTVNENIADLGAVTCIVDIAKKRGASDEEFKLMFSSFSKIWASVEAYEYMELLLLQDVHAPNEFRVNAVLSSTDEFYQVYDIYPWNKMWISKKDRVIVW